MEKFNIAIVGCGSIGALKNNKFDSPITENIFTHAHAVCLNKSTELIGVVDVDEKKAKAAAKKWKTKAYSTIKSLVIEREFLCGKNNNVDIWIVATPTETHWKVVNEVVNYRPSLIIVEKPVAENSTDCEKIRRLCDISKIPILVNYSRRFDLTSQHIHRLFTMGFYGHAQACTIKYNRGLKRDGCHALDFLMWFFGEPVKGIGPIGASIVDLSPHDLTSAYHIQFEKCYHTFMVPIDGRISSIFEIEMVFENAIIKWENSGLEIVKRGLIDSPYGPYKTFGGPEDRVPTYLNIVLQYLLKNATDYLQYNTTLLCTVDDALQVHKLIEDLRGGDKL